MEEHVHLQPADDEDFLAGLGITPETIDVPAPIIQPNHVELLDCFEMSTEPLTRSSTAGIVTLRARANTLAYSSFPLTRDADIHLEYGTGWHDGEQFLFSSVANEKRTFGIGLAATYVDYFDKKCVQWLLRGPNGAEVRIRETVRPAIYGRVLTSSEWQSRAVEPYVETMATAESGDVIDVVYSGGGKDVFEVARISDRGTLYVRRPGRKSLLTLTRGDFATLIRSVRIVSKAGSGSISGVGV